MTPDDFRIALPEFTRIEVYPDQTVYFWLNEAKATISAYRWGQFYTQGLLYYTAHNLALSAGDQDAASDGGVPGGGAGGVVTSKAIGSASVSYDAGLSTIEDGGAYNTTTYGIRFWQLAKMVGIGGLQL